MIKGQYNIYSSITDAIVSAARKHKLGRKASIEDCVKYVFRETGVKFDSFEACIMAEEMMWAERSRVVVFPESIEVLNKIRKAKLTIESFKHIGFPHESFYLAFPKNYKIACLPAAGCLVSYMKLEDRPQYSYEKFSKRYGLGAVEKSGEQTDKNLIISFVTPTEKKETHSRLNYDTKTLTECLQCENAYEYEKFVGIFNNCSIGQPVQKTALDSRYEFELLQIIARIAIYTSACDSLTEGYPFVRPKFLEPKGVKYKDYTLSMVSGREGGHRSWHFRQLVNKRYYQNEHALKPVGSRIVFVRESDSSINIEAETLK